MTKIILSFFFSLCALADCQGIAPCLEIINQSDHLFRSRIMKKEDTERRLVTIASQYIGTPYAFGGNSREGIDCSAYIQQIFKAVGIHLPRTSREQFSHHDLLEVSRNELKTNDLLFFKAEGKDEIDHVALYIGEGKMIHSSRKERGVQITDFKFSTFWSSRFVSAKRITKEIL
jgi:peptidoglycan endopeptidase LytE